MEGDKMPAITKFYCDVCGEEISKEERHKLGDYCLYQFRTNYIEGIGHIIFKTANGSGCFHRECFLKVLNDNIKS